MQFRRRSTGDLSGEALQVMDACFHDNLSAKATASRIEDATGESIPVRTLGRRRREWNLEQLARREAREQIEVLLDATRGGNATAESVIAVLATQPLTTGLGDDVFTAPAALKLIALRLEAVLHRQRRAVAALDQIWERAGAGEQVTKGDLAGLRQVLALEPGSGGAASP